MSYYISDTMSISSCTPLLRSTICHGADLVKYAVTKGTLTMASTAWMKDKDDRAVALVMPPMLEVKSV